MNQEILKQRYVDFRMKMRSTKDPQKRKNIKEEMSIFLKQVADVFGNEVVLQLTKKK